MRHPERDQKVMLPTREGIIGQQFANVLNVINGLGPFLLYNPHRDIDGTEQKRPDLDGGAACAAATTFINACSCLDEMLKDPSRWNMTAHDELYKSMSEVNEAQKKFLDAQRAASENLTRPSFNLRPKLVMMKNEFLAYWGDPLTPGMAIIGHGATPDLALRDFDAAFQRVPEQQVIAIAGAMGFDLGLTQEAPPAPEPAPDIKPPKRKRKS